LLAPLEYYDGDEALTAFETMGTEMINLNTETAQGWADQKPFSH
jgi:hypothetical protein